MMSMNSAAASVAAGKVAFENLDVECQLVAFELRALEYDDSILHRSVLGED